MLPLLLLLLLFRASMVNGMLVVPDDKLSTSDVEVPTETVVTGAFEAVPVDASLQFMLLSSAIA